MGGERDTKLVGATERPVSDAGSDRRRRRPSPRTARLPGHGADRESHHAATARPWYSGNRAGRRRGDVVDANWTRMVLVGGGDHGRDSLEPGDRNMAAHEAVPKPLVSSHLLRQFMEQPRRLPPASGDIGDGTGKG